MMSDNPDQRRFPLATLVSEASKRGKRQAIRLLALAYRVARERERERGIPDLIGAG